MLSGRRRLSPVLGRRGSGREAGGGVWDVAVYRTDPATIAAVRLGPYWAIAQVFAYIYRSSLSAKSPRFRRSLVNDSTALLWANSQANSPWEIMFSRLPPFAPAAIGGSEFWPSRIVPCSGSGIGASTSLAILAFFLSWSPRSWLSRCNRESWGPPTRSTDCKRRMHSGRQNLRCSQTSTPSLGCAVETGSCKAGTESGNRY